MPTDPDPHDSQSASTLIEQIYAATAKPGKRRANARPAGKTPVRLPGDNYHDSKFADDLGKALADKPIFRRGRVVGILDAETRSFLPIDGRIFRTEVEYYIWPYLLVTDNRSGETYEKGHSMTNDHAETALASNFFLTHIRPIDHIHTLSMPCYDEEGNLRLLPPGYDPHTRTYTFPLQ